MVGLRAVREVAAGNMMDDPASSHKGVGDWTLSRVTSAMSCTVGWEEQLLCGEYRTGKVVLTVGRQEVLTAVGQTQDREGCPCCVLSLDEKSFINLYVS